MAFKRGPVFYVDLRPHGYGKRIGPLSARTKRRSLAEQIEATIREFSSTGRHDLLDALRAGKFSITELHAAKVKGTLSELIQEAQDPPLSAVIADFRSGINDERYLPALDRLLDLAPENARVSWLDDPDNLRKLIRVYRKLGLAAATERREMAGVSKLVRECLGESRRREIFREVTLRRPDSGRTRWLNSEEIQRLRAHSGDWWVLFGLAISTGMRRGELLSLRVSDLDFEIGSVAVERGKSARARRLLPLSGEPLTDLQRWIEENRLEPTDLIFGEVSIGGLRHAWERTRDAAGLEKVRFHDLRHTFAVHHAKTGIPLVELQQRLGHSSIVMTMRYSVYAPPLTSPHHKLALQRLGLA